MRAGAKDGASVSGASGGPEAEVTTTSGADLDVSPRPGSTAGSRRMAMRMAARDLRRHPWRTLLVLLLIGLPVFAVAFGSTMVASTSMPTDQERLHRQLWGFDGVITATEVGDHFQAPDDPFILVDRRTAEGAGLDVAGLDREADRIRVCPGPARPEQPAQDAAPGAPGSSEPSCTVEEAAAQVLGSGGGLLTVQEVPLQITTSGAPLAVTVHIADFQDARLVGPDRRFELTEGASPGDGAALANPALHQALAEASERARNRDAAEVLTDRVAVRQSGAEGPGTNLRLGGTMIDRQDDQRLLTDALLPRYPLGPALFVQEGTPFARELTGQGTATAYLSGTVPEDYASVRALNQAGFTGLFQGRATAEDEVSAAFDRIRGTGSDWAALLPLALIGVLALAETGLLAGAAFAVGARQQRRATALLSVTGAEPSTLRQTMVYSGLWCGVLAGVLGAGLGVLAGCVLVWAARGPEVQVYGPHVPWPVVLGALLLGLLCAVVAAWIPARAVARQDAWAAIKGAAGQRTPVRRWPVIVGTVLTMLGLGTALAATVYGMTVPTIGELLQVTNTLILMLIGSTVLLLLGVLLLIPGIVALGSRAAGRLPVALRIATRDAHRNRSRTVPITAAVVAATAVGTVVLSSMAFNMGERDQYSRGGPDARTASVYVQDPEQLERVLAFERKNYDPDITLEQMGMYAGGPEGVTRLVQGTRSLPGAPSLVDSWTLSAPTPTCAEAHSRDCSDLQPLYPLDSRCHLPVPNTSSEAERRAQLREGAAQRPRQLARACGVRGGSMEVAPFFSSSPLDGILVVDPDAPETVPRPVLHEDPELVRALERGQAVVFDPELIDAQGRVSLGEFSMDPSTVAGMVSDVFTQEQLESMGPGAAEQPSTPLEGRHPVWEPERTVTLDAVRAAPLSGDTPLMVIPVSALDGMDQRMAVSNVLFQFREPLTQGQVDLLNDELAQDQLVLSAQGGGSEDLLIWGIAGVMALIVITVAGITTGLALADARRDQTVLSSIGANPGTRKSMAAAQTLMAALVGTVLGVPVGVLGLVGVGLVLNGDTARIPWWPIVVLVVGVPLLAAALTWIVVPSRLPVREADRD